MLKAEIASLQQEAADVGFQGTPLSVLSIPTCIPACSHFCAVLGAMRKSQSGPIDHVCHSSPRIMISSNTRSYKRTPSSHLRGLPAFLRPEGVSGWCSGHPTLPPTRRGAVQPVPWSIIAHSVGATTLRDHILHPHLHLDNSRFVLTSRHVDPGTPCAHGALQTPERVNAA